MPSTKSYKQRLKALDGTKKVAKAIGLISTVKFQQLLQSFYHQKNVVKLIEDSTKFFLQEEEIRNKKILIIISSDRGLCGAYNQNVVKFLKNYLKKEKFDQFIFLGKKGKLLSKLEGELYSFADNLQELKKVLEILYSKYKEEKSSISVCFTKYKNFLKQEVDCYELLPLPKRDVGNVRPVFFEGLDYEEKIKKMYFFWRFYEYWTESLLSEQASRMQMTETMKKNSDDLMKKIQRQMNKLRQSLITKELSEIVAGMR